MWVWYKSMLLKHPLATKATTSCIIMSMSDVAVQYLEQQQESENLTHKSAIRNHTGHSTPSSEHSRLPSSTANTTEDEHVTRSMFEWDIPRTIQVGITGLTFTGPLAHGWYKILEQVVRTNSKAIGVPLRMLLDATLFSPVAVGGYFVWRTDRKSVV